jgi:hypothetical protein
LHGYPSGARRPADVQPDTREARRIVRSAMKFLGEADHMRFDFVSERWARAKARQPLEAAIGHGFRFTKISPNRVTNIIPDAALRAL